MSASILAAPRASSPLARVCALIAALALLGGCSDLSTTQQRVLSGAAIGTAAGAVTTAMTGGCVACGAAIGGAVGAGTGYVYDYVEKKNW